MLLKDLNPGCRMVKFEDIAESVAVRVSPSKTDSDVYVGLEHLDPKTIHLRTWGHPSDVEGDKLKFKKGDVIFGRRRAYQRKLAVAEFDGICSAHAMVVRAKPKMILPEFLPFFLLSDMFMERAIEISVGSLSPTINWKTLKEQEFLLPPVEKQKRLAEILWAADDSAEKCLSTYHCLTKFAHAFAVHNFLLHEARKKHPDIPAGWSIGTLDKLAIVDPKMPKGIEDDLEVSFIPMESVQESGEIAGTDIRKYKEVKKGYTYFAEKDILFAKITPCMENNKGAIANGLKNNIGMGSTEFFVFRTKKEEDRNFIYYLTMSKTYRKAAERWMQGSAGQRRVPRDFFTKRPIVIPSEAARKHIGETLSAIDQRIQETEKHYRTLNLMKMQLLNSIFSQ
jgi:restriction endonuclease S subunit